MNFSLKLLGAFAALVLVVGCGGATSGDGSGGHGNGSCTIAAGTYTLHLTAEAGGTNCGAVADQTLTLSGNETLTSGSTSIADGGSGCSTSVSSSGCTFTENCSFDEGTTTSVTTTTYTFSGGSATGKEVSEVESGGTVVSSCTYDLTITKN